MKSGTIYIGTSGWMYKDWARDLYPAGMKQGHLAYFASEFKTVEVNSSFYHLPLKSTFKKWHDETPERFIFSVKLSRYITHQKRLRGSRRALERFMRRAAPLADKIGAILVQLPPSLAFDEKVLRRFLEDMDIVKKRTFHASFVLEPRHISWFSAEHLPLLAARMKEAGVAFVFAHSASIPSIAPERTNIFSDIVYIRFHGPQTFASSRYGARRLKPWAERMLLWASEGKTVFAYFNNDVHGHAIHDARTLIRQCGHAHA